MVPAVPLTGGAKLPLAFIGLGLVALGLSVALMCSQPDLVFQPFLHPRVVALVHAFLPGFLLSICMGALYQLGPVVLNTPLQLRLGAAWWHLWLHGLGTAALVAGLHAGRHGWAAAGGTALSLGVLILVVGILRTFRRSTRRDTPAWSLVLAVGWLLVTVSVGILLALNRRSGFIPLSVVDLLKGHAHLGLAGFFLTLLQGVTFQLIPMFTMGTFCRPRYAAAGLIGTQFALLLLAPSLAFAWRPGVLMGATLLGVAIGCSGIAFVATFRSRRRRKLEPGILGFATGAGFLAAAAVLGIAIAFWTGGGAQILRAISAYGTLAIAGALSLTILGMLCKIVPFLVWMRVYGSLVGKRTVPPAPTLGSRQMETAWLVMHVSGIGLLLLAVASGSSIAASAGTGFLAAGVLCFLGSMARVARHLWQPVPPAAGVALRPVHVS